MNRRRFLELLGMATVGAGVAYSFPSIIVPKNIIIPDAATIRMQGYMLSSAFQYQGYCQEFLEQMFRMTSYVTDYDGSLLK